MGSDIEDIKAFGQLEKYMDEETRLKIARTIGMVLCQDLVQIKMRGSAS